MNAENKVIYNKPIDNKRTRVDSVDLTPNLTKTPNLNSPFNYKINEKSNDNKINPVMTSILNCPNKTKTVPFIPFKKGSPQKQINVTKILKTKKVGKIQTKHVSKKWLIKKEVKVNQKN